MWDKVKEWLVTAGLILLLVALMIFVWKFALVFWKLKFVLAIFIILCTVLFLWLFA